MKILASLFVGFLFFVPTFAFAASHVYTCSDLATLSGGASCTSDVFTLPSGAGGAESTSAITAVGGATVYITARTTGGSAEYCVPRSITGSTAVTWSGDITDQSYTINGNGSVVRESLGASGAGLCNGEGASSAQATVTYFCISDAADGSCAPPAPPAPTPTTTVQYVDNYNQDTAMIVLAFMYSMSFAMWMFRKKN